MSGAHGPEIRGIGEQQHALGAARAARCRASRFGKTDYSELQLVRQSTPGFRLGLQAGGLDPARLRWSLAGSGLQPRSCARLK